MTAKLVPPELINLENQMDEWFAMQRGEVSDPVADYLNAHPPNRIGFWATIYRIVRRIW